MLKHSPVARKVVSAPYNHLIQIYGDQYEQPLAGRLDQSLKFLQYYLRVYYIRVRAVRTIPFMELHVSHYRFHT